jgi:hypothetical protein
MMHVVPDDEEVITVDVDNDEEVGGQQPPTKKHKGKQIPWGDGGFWLACLQQIEVDKPYLKGADGKIGLRFGEVANTLRLHNAFLRNADWRSDLTGSKLRDKFNTEKKKYEAKINQGANTSGYDPHTEEELVMQEILKQIHNQDEVKKEKTEAEKKRHAEMRKQELRFNMREGSAATSATSAGTSATVNATPEPVRTKTKKRADEDADDDIDAGSSADAFSPDLYAKQLQEREKRAEERAKALQAERAREAAAALEGREAAQRQQEANLAIQRESLEELRAMRKEQQATHTQNSVILNASLQALQKLLENNK